MKVEVTLGKGIKREFAPAEYGFGELSPVAFHLAMIGFKNVVQDAHAGKDDEASVVAVDAKIARLKAGELRVSRAPREDADPVRAEAVKMARKDIAAIFTIKGEEIRVRDKAQWSEIKAVLSTDGHDFETVEGVEAVREFLVSAQADTYMDAAAKIVAERQKAIKTVSLAGLIKKA